MDQAQSGQKHFEAQVELGHPSLSPNATQPRVELCLIRSDAEAQEITRFLVEDGFFTKGPCYTLRDTNMMLKVVEGWDAESERS